MGLLDSLERGIEKAVRGAFSGRGGSLGPVEIATAVRRHMDRESTTERNGQSTVPNLYKIRLAEEDFSDARKYGVALAEELCEEIIRYADSQGYTLPGPVKATFVKNTELKRGQMSIETQSERSVDPGVAVSRPSSSPAAGPAATAALPGRMRSPGAGAPRPAEAAFIEHEGHRLPLEHGTSVIGRSSSADITISDTGISRQHLEIIREGRRWYARDLGSTNGSYVDGEELRSAETEIYDGALITLGNARLRFRLG